MSILKFFAGLRRVVDFGVNTVSTGNIVIPFWLVFLFPEAIHYISVHV